VAKLTPQQEGGVDCGVFACAIAKHLSDKLKNDPNILTTDFTEEEKQTIKNQITPIREWLHTQGLRDDEGIGSTYSSSESTGSLDIAFKSDTIKNKLETNNV